MYSDRDRIQTERESQTKGFVEKMEELTHRVTELPGGTWAVQIEHGAATEADV